MSLWGVGRSVILVWHNLSIIPPAEHNFEHNTLLSRVVPLLHVCYVELYPFPLAACYIKLCLILEVSLGVRTCELFLCFVAIVRVRAIVLTSLFSLFYVTGEFHRFLHRGRARFRILCRQFKNRHMSIYKSFYIFMAMKLFCSMTLHTCISRYTDWVFMFTKLNMSLVFLAFKK